MSLSKALIRLLVVSVTLVVAGDRAGPVAHVGARHGASAGERARVPDCSGAESWPTSMAFVHLKNEGITDNEKVDFEKTKTTRLASEQIGEDLFRQVHRVTFTEKSGHVMEAITVNDASLEECSMSGVDVFLVAMHLGGRESIGPAR